MDLLKLASAQSHDILSCKQHTLRKKIMFKAKNVLLLFLSCILPFVILELFLRLFFGYPHGSFNFLLAAKDGLYPRNSTVIMDYGFKPYTVKTNSLGMRSKEVSLKKTNGIIRIMAIGDSVTDGYFVENESTYPYMLEQILNDRKQSAEVLNVARGGGSIDKEFALLKAAMPLKPDIVILTFVTNDIADINGRSRDELLSLKMWTVTKKMPEWMLTKTAIGEFIGDLRLRLKYKNFKLADRDKKRSSEHGMQAEMAKQYEKNVEIFNKSYKQLDGIVMKEPFSDEVNLLIDNYAYALKNLHKFCLDNNAILVFVYFPNYAQVYDLSSSLKIRDVVQEMCAKESIPFLDMTETYRNKAKGKVLHFAPMDFHCNPEGNKILAESIADFLKNRNLVK